MANWYISSHTGIAVTDLGTGSNSAGATLALTSLTVPAGALIVVLVTENTSASAGTCADGASNTYAVPSGGSVALPSSNGFVQIFRAYNVSALTNQSITYTKQTSGRACAISAFYVTGIQTSGDPVDASVTATASGTSSAPAATTGTPSQIGTLLVMGVGWENASAGTAFTQSTNANFGAPFSTNNTLAAASAAGANAVSMGRSPVAYAGILGASGSWGAIALGFKLAAPPSTGHYGVAPWAASHVYAAGAIVRQLAMPNVGSERCFRTSAGGTSGGSEPVWNLAKGSAQPSDNTVTDWTEVTGNETYQSPGAWSAPAARLATMTKGSYVSAVASIPNGGSGGTYAVNDILTENTLSSGVVYSDRAVVKVTSASGGKVTGASVVTGGSYSQASGNVSCVMSGGGGTGCQISLTFTVWSASNDNFYVGSAHAETQPTALTIQSQATTTNSQPTILCVDETGAGHVPPTSADLKTAATVSTTGNSAMTLSDLGYVNGITFSAGSGANTVNMGFAASVGYMDFENCGLVLGATTGGQFTFGNQANIRNILNNTTLKFGVAAQFISVTGSLLWKNTPSAILGVTPSALIGSMTGTPCIFDGVDISALGSGKTIVQSGAQSNEMTLLNCKLGSSVTVAAAPGAIASNRTNLISCDSGGATYRSERYWFEGTQTTETTVVRTGGASDGTTAISWKIVTTANVAWFHPYETFQIAERNTVTGSNRTCTLYGVMNAAALPNTDDIWLDVEYFGASGSPLASFASGTKANILASGSAQSADSASGWDSLVTARANTHTYSVGDVIKLASNPGRIFFCTTGGASAGSEPGGYASAADGGSVTDNAAVFRAGVRFSMAVTLSAPQPQLAGYLRAIVRAAKASTTFYVDPKLTLS